MRILSSLFLLAATAAFAQNYSQLRIIAFGAHPDDCDSKAGGVGAKWAAAGHKVKFVSEIGRASCRERV